MDKKALELKLLFKDHQISLEKIEALTTEEEVKKVSPVSNVNYASDFIYIFSC